MAERPLSTTAAEAAEAREREWLAKVYRGGQEREITVRAILLGALIGAVMCLSNLYVGFKAGWSLGVTITAAIMAFALFKAIRTALPFFVKRDMGILETNFLVTIASACAFIASAGLSNAVPALLMVSGKALPTWQLALWVATILFLGLFMAIPMKRQMINVEDLKFPTGYATSEVLKGMYAAGGDAVKKARALFGALGVGVIIAWLRDGVLGFPKIVGGHVAKEFGVWQWRGWPQIIPATLIPPSWSILGMPLSRLTLTFEGSLIMVGAGAIMGIRAGASLLLAAVVGYGILAPRYIAKGDIPHDPPTLTAAAFEGAPSVLASKDAVFPLRVEAGQTLAFEIEEPGRPSLLVARTWTAPAEFADARALEAYLSAPLLDEGGPNPLAGVVAVTLDRTANRLRASLASDLSGPAVLSVAAATERPALAFEPGAHARVLRFPLTLPADTRLSFAAGQASGPEDPVRPETFTFGWNRDRTYESGEALAADLNAERLPCGRDNPLHGRISVEMERGRLVARATAFRTWDASIEALDTDGGRLLGFEPGQAHRVPYGGFRNIVRWLMWPGVAMMVTAGLLAFFMQWRTVLRAFSGLAAMFRPKGAASGPSDPLASVEVPGSWFATGFLGAGLVAVLLQVWFFGIHWWMGALAVVMSFFLAIVACRATGETDITPVGAMGKITQLMYGAIAPGNMSANLMTANVTAGAATSSADLLQALRCGFMVGASPRKQFLGMLFGVAVGSLVSAPVYNLLIPSADVLGTDKLPAPAAQTWAGVALLLSNGLQALPVSARWGLFWGGLLGIVLTLLERAFPKARRFMPSPTAMGIAFVIPAFNSVSMFLGAFIAWILEKRRPAFGEAYTVPVASGLIAGESLTGIGVAMLIAFGLMG
ncbi:MAG: OPT/YSL family transporter [Acidobacteriota bacterium]